jgi:uncharacterized membrane protein (UPF0182 family)
MKFNFRRISWISVLLIFILSSVIVNFYTDWLWFLELGFESMFLTAFFAKVSIALVVGVFVFLLLYLNIFLFRRLTNNEPINMTINKGTYVETLDITSIVNKFTVPIFILFGLFSGIAFASSWQTVLLFLNKVSFGILDPIFSKDISFYIFSVPFFELIASVLSFVLFVSFVVAVLLYLAKGALIIKNRASLNLASFGGDLFTINREAKVHLFILVAFWFLLKAFKIYFIQMPNLLLSENNLFVGASYSDINATLPIFYVLSILAIIFAFLIIFSIRKSGIKVLVSSFVLYFVVSFLGLSVYPMLLKSLVIKPNELNKESPYIKNHIKATQEAWGIANVTKRNFSGNSSLTMEDIKKNEATIENIRLWDRAPLLDTFGQLQEIRTYYDFVSADNDRYSIDDKYRQVLLSARELDSNSLPQRNFINERLSFTHGIGVALSPVNEKTKEGLPVLFVKDLPPKSEKEELKIERPEIYFGEKSNDYVIVKTKAKEFDYPKGEENIYASYEGSGGVQMSSFLKKAVFSLKFNSLKILLSNDLTKESRIMYSRNIKERVEKAFSFLIFDNDPYIVINEGKIFWIYDAYTTSNKYPYSQNINGKNYMRNSVKVVIDAYNGKMNAYISDKNDPIIKSFAGIFKNIFLPIEEAPESLRAHFRYPEDIFTYQTVLYSVYHMEEPQIFYNKEDLWEMPKIKGSNRGENMGPVMRHLIMRLPGEEKAEFILMAPFTPKGKNNMSAWVAARSDGENYGELVVYRFPKQSLVYGPKQIVNRINQDAEISRQISLWDQRGSEVLQGNLSVIPINESILYIRPLYLRAEGGKIPELKRVIVAYENKISMEETLDRALANIFSGLDRNKKDSSKTNKIDKKISVSDEQKNLIKEANLRFINAQAALRRGDWARYGEEIKKLGEVLKKIK